MKLTIYDCDSHDHCVGFLDDEEVFSNDYCVENVLRLADHLGWEVKIITLNSDEFEEKFA